jgi:hypothetical protein
MGLEAVVEKEARKHLEKRGGMMLKFVSPGYNGPPDRICFHINCTAFLIEFKAPGKSLRPEQRKACTEMAAAGARIYAGPDFEGIRTIKDAIEIIDDEIDNRVPRRHPIVSGL